MLKHVSQEFQDIASEKVSTADDGEEESEFVKRMIERAYADKHFEDAEVITELALCKRQANRHAAVLVITTIIKLIDKILQAIESSDEELLDKHVKLIYSHCARIYVAD